MRFWHSSRLRLAVKRVLLPPFFPASPTVHSGLAHKLREPASSAGQVPESLAGKQEDPEVERIIAGERMLFESRLLDGTRASRRWGLVQRQKIA
jgi:hypothetical protein